MSWQESLSWFGLVHVISLSVVFLAVAAGLAGPARAQSDKPAPPSRSSADPDPKSNAGGQRQLRKRNPRMRSIRSSARPPKSRRNSRKESLNIELSKTYKKWLNEDVVWIITDEERAAFKQLSNDEERDNFIEAFWQRRDPTPDTEENEYKEEHYRRIAYANEHFAAGIPGWKSDRGRIYIMYGARRRNRLASLRRHLRAAHGRRRRRDLHVPLRRLALPLPGRHRAGSHHRIRRHLHVRRLPHDDRPVGEGCAEIHAQRRSDAVRADGHGQQVEPFHWRWFGATGNRPDELQTRQPSSSTAWSSLPSCKRRRRSSSRIWKKSSIPRSSPT